MNEEERKFWIDIFKLILDGGKSFTEEVAEYADEALKEFRKRLSEKDNQEENS